MNSSFKLVSLLTLAFAISLPTIHADDDHTPLGEQMSALNKPYRSLSRALKKTPDPAMKDQYVEWAESILIYAEKSVDILPSMIANMETEAGAKHAADYKKSMQETVTSIEGLIETLKAEDFAQAKVILDEINQQKKSGHFIYQED
ncbi:MAG: cytochrome b562 [Verrucomicrobiota bacterium]